MAKLQDLTATDAVNVSNRGRDIEFRELLDKEGFKNFEGDSYLDKDKYFNKYAEKLCYVPCRCLYTSVEFALESGYTVYPSTLFAEISEQEKLINLNNFTEDLLEQINLSN
jgi:hypothetical protein